MRDRENIKIGVLPDLRIVGIDSLRFHEEHNENRVKVLKNRLRDEGILKHPPVVMSTEEPDRYILIDGANRVTTLGELGITHLPVQIVKLTDPLLEISSWHHAVEGFGKDEFLHALSNRAGVEVVPESAELMNKTLLCDLVFNNGDTYHVYNSNGLEDRVNELRLLTGAYLKTGSFDRVSYTDLEDLKKHYPDFETLILFSDFSKNDIREIAGNGVRLPSGLTRVILPKRALGLNLELKLLRSSDDLASKNIWLSEMIHKKVSDKSIRFYQEQTFVFNE